MEKIIIYTCGCIQRVSKIDGTLIKEDSCERHNGGLSTRFEDYNKPRDIERIVNN